MKTYIAFAFFMIFPVQYCFAQCLASAYKPKNKNERLIIEKIRGLREVQEFFHYAKRDHPDFIINPPDATFNGCYAMQVGVDYGDIFRTHFWLLIHPKTFRIYYEDFDEGGMQTITLQQWRYWRKRPEFNKPHQWVSGRLILVKRESKRVKYH